MSAATTRKTAEERRDSVIAEASKEFAAGGYAGTSTEAIARRVGVSQPYLFQLFGTKRDLFIAVTRGCFGRTRAAFEASAQTRAGAGTNAGHRNDGPDGHGRDVQRPPAGPRHAAVCSCRPTRRAPTRTSAPSSARSSRPCTARWQPASGADDVALEAWFAEGMLLNVAAAIGNTTTTHGLTLASLGGAS